MEKIILTKDEKTEAWKNWCGQSFPVAVSLEILNRLGVLEKVEGGTSKGMHLFPFSVRIKNYGYVCKPTDLHKLTKTLNIKEA